MIGQRLLNLVGALFLVSIDRSHEQFLGRILNLPFLISLSSAFFHYIVDLRVLTGYYCCMVAICFGINLRFEVWAFDLSSSLLLTAN